MKCKMKVKYSILIFSATKISSETYKTNKTVYTYSIPYFKYPENDLFYNFGRLNYINPINELPLIKKEKLVLMH